MARIISLTSQSHPPKPSFKPISSSNSLSEQSTSRRAFVSISTVSSLIALVQPPYLIAQTSSSSSKTILSGITSTKSWFRYYGDGFAIRVPPGFEDIMEPEDYNAGLSLYGDKAKPKTFAARFATPDGSEVLSVVVRPSNQLKITFLEAKDVSDLGTLKEAKKIFVPGGTDLYSARAIKIKEDEVYRLNAKPLSSWGSHRKQSLYSDGVVARLSTSYPPQDPILALLLVRSTEYDDDDDDIYDFA